jgi:hypothetical protein
MKRFIPPQLVWLLLIVSVAAGAQTSNATLSGVVLDPQSAVVPNTRVTAENIATGIVLNTITNDAGVYLFPSVQPGVYRLTAEAPGFAPHVLNDVTVAVGARMNLNFPLQVAPLGDVVAVNVQPEALVTGTATVGAVITAQQIADLPIGTTALGAVATQPGIVGDNFAGSRIGAVNVTIDGVNVQDQNINTGVNSVIVANKDNVEEVRVVTSPVDAEFGRGSGQVQIATKSGSNAFHGTAYEYHSSTALNANNWFNNLRGDPRDSSIANTFGAVFGGPITREKTFFSFNYEGRTFRGAESITAATYTDTARQGLFRFFPGVQNGNANSSTPTVDLLGNPVRPVSATGSLQTVSLFNRDPLRPGLDPSGAVQRLLSVMPHPNDFRN